MNCITPQELNKLFADNESFQLIDVREELEFEICKIEGAINFPLSEFNKHIEKINNDGKVIVYCHHGIRSAQAILMMISKKSNAEFYNLLGGIHQWAVQIDNTVPLY
jgi:rhodanese-related sulfurtransferase